VHGTYHGRGNDLKWLLFFFVFFLAPSMEIYYGSILNIIQGVHIYIHRGLPPDALPKQTGQEKKVFFLDIWNLIYIESHTYREDVLYFMCSIYLFGYLKYGCLYWITYGVAMTSRLLKSIGLFCKRTLQKRLYSAKETYNFKEPTNRSHPTWCIAWDHMKRWSLL